MQRWHVLMTKPRQEKRVARALTRRGIAVFAPTLSYTGRRGRVLDKPFFPRYLFARFEWELEGLAQVQWTPGLSQVVSFEGEPAWIEDSVLDYLSERLEGIDGDDLLRIKAGERVRVVGGPFRDFEAVFDRHLNGEGRAAVLLEILGRKTQVELDLCSIERVSPT
jgi:transcription elongation factor/antiterminator RfaH